MKKRKKIEHIKSGDVGEVKEKLKEILNPSKGGDDENKKEKIAKQIQ